MLPQKGGSVHTLGHQSTAIDYHQDDRLGDCQLATKMPSHNMKQPRELSDTNFYDNTTEEDAAKLEGDADKDNTVVLYEQYQQEFEDLKRDSSQFEREVSYACQVIVVHVIDHFHSLSLNVLLFSISPARPPCHCLALH